MWDVILETLIDSVKLIPFLFITYLIMEWIEHKTKEKTKEERWECVPAKVTGNATGYFCGTHSRFAYWNQKKVQTGKKIISPYFFTESSLFSTGKVW